MRPYALPPDARHVTKSPVFNPSGAAFISSREFIASTSFCDQRQPSFPPQSFQAINPAPGYPSAPGLLFAGVFRSTAWRGKYRAM